MQREARNGHPLAAARAADYSALAMLAPPDLRAVRTIISHDNCADGLASAVLLHDALPDAAIRFAQYGTSAHLDLAPAPGTLFCDFSPHPSRTAEFAAAGTIVLDHHRSAKPIVDAMGERGVFGDEAAEPGVSGAVLAYRHVWLPLRADADAATAAFAERFATIAGVRDTWQTKHPLWRESCVQHAALMTFPRAWWLARCLHDVAAAWESHVREVGEVVLVRHEDRVRRAIDDGYRFTTSCGARVLAVQGVSVTSDGAEMLGDSVDLVVGFSYGVEGNAPKLRFSLRSHTGFDCAAFAKARGGGGHTAAAGFSVAVASEDPQPFRLIEGMLLAEA